MLKIMTLRLIIILPLCIFSISCFCQDGSKVLIYANKTDFLLPYIKVTLEEMTDNESGKKIFYNRYKFKFALCQY